MENNAKDIHRTVISGEEQINKWLNLEFPYFFNTFLTFWPSSILYHGLENQFYNSILFQHFQYHVGTLYLPKKHRINKNYSARSCNLRNGGESSNFGKLLKSNAKNL